MKTTTHCLFSLAIMVFCSFHGASAVAAVIDDDDILHVPSGETYTLDGAHTYNLFVHIEGTLYVTDYDGTGTTGTLALHAPDITISGTVDADGRGFRGGRKYVSDSEGPGAAIDGAGAGYGGEGGDSGHGGYGGAAYGTASGCDIDMGSGGGHANGYSSSTVAGGDGGASIVLGGSSISISGTVTASGGPGDDYNWAAGGGSGGGIVITGSDIVLTGSLSANGGAGGNGTWGGGGAGGGRVKIFYDTSFSSGGSSITYAGGAGGSGSWAGQTGQVGTYDYTAVERTIGDLNCDGAINGFDIDPFVLALTDLDAYYALYPCCNHMLADCNDDGAVDGFDIDAFVDLLTAA